MKNVRKMVYSGLLIALSIIIPIAFSFLRVQIGPFSATLTSHLPLFIAMLLGPAAAAVVGFGSALGFLISATPVIAARAFMHTFVGLTGGLLIKRGTPFSKAVMLTAPIHAILEAIAVIPFGFTMHKVLIVVGVGTLLHHIVDGIISFSVVKAVSKGVNFDMKASTSK